MHVSTLVLIAALPLAAAASPRTPTLAEVTTSAPDASITVNCRYVGWPTVHQVAHYLGHDDNPEASKPMRRYIVKEGRRVCRTGATHVLVEFYRGHPDREVAVQNMP